MTASVAIAVTVDQDVGQTGELRDAAAAESDERAPGRATLSTSPERAREGRERALARVLVGMCRDTDDVPDPRDVHRPFAGAQLLLVGVLTRAVADLDVTTGKDAEAVAAAAAAWIWGDDLGGPGWSFVEVCDELRVHPDFVRRLAAEVGGQHAQRPYVFAGDLVRRRKRRPTI